MKSKKIIISGGGTGGHIYPAVAIANELKAIDPNTEILFVGAEGKMEMEKVPKAGYHIVGLPIAGFNRSNMLANLGLPFKIIKSLWKTFQVLQGFKPDAAVGVGGYASGPTLFVAAMLGIPTLLQEQNSYAGVTNKFLAKRAKKICVAYPNMEAFFPKEKVIMTGNPVRKDIAETTSKRVPAFQHFGLEPNKKTLLVIGGSQGAKTINEAIYAGVEILLKDNWQIIWQTGKLFIDKAREKAETLQNKRLYVSDFIYEMDFAYAAADMVVSRAGALSVSEICLVEKPCILVPLPTASEDHQTKNAQSLVDADAALMIKDGEAKDELIKAIVSLSVDYKTMSQLSRNIKLLAKPHAGKEIAEEVMKIA